ncbi:conserved protein of unknown function (plasmid) [Cupriavidus taiwanensis]|uniref:Uncharacterized protein n=1 Tax=Cupriavidus taiwanensis TaxID=164546 RepID=A0A375IKS0_9BURK|nr:hypothetical protein [Cupriavidus taiwanensis]SPK75147.1 conserved protein of unknown function [Cupriavidus taiwanensis]
MGSDSGRLQRRPFCRPDCGRHGISLIPIVDTICDIRDLCANIRAYRKDPGNKLILFFIALTIIGFFPEVGSVIKGVIKIAFVYIRKYLRRVDEIFDATKLGRATNQALDAALPKITEFLSSSRVVKWATKEGVADIYRFCSKKITELAGLVNGAKLKAQFLTAADKTEKFLGRLKYIVPGSTREKLNDFLDFLGKNKQKMANGLERFTGPIRTILKITAKRLDDHAWIAYTQTHNKGWIAPISREGAAGLINRRPPSWVNRAPKLPHPAPNILQAQSTQKKLEKKIADRAAKGLSSPPMLDLELIQTFEHKKISIEVIQGPAKLYRIVDPTSAAGGIFWVDERTFHSLKNRSDWREQLAVKPDWNQNGQYVVYEISAGEGLPVWKGPAASQELDGTPYHLPGGAEQLVFFPPADTLAPTRPRIDPSTGKALPGRKPDQIDSRIDWQNVTGRTAPAVLRGKVNDKHVRGPFETGWGFSDRNHSEAKGIMLALPDSKK